MTLQEIAVTVQRVPTYHHEYSIQSFLNILIVGAPRYHREYIPFQTVWAQSDYSISGRKKKFQNFGSPDSLLTLHEGKSEVR